jgi:hypothetical protein
MKGTFLILISSAMIFAQADSTNSPPVDPGGIRNVEAPIGQLGCRIGTYVTIEGTRSERGKAGLHTLQVDRVGTNRLTQPVQIWIENVELPAGGRCLVKGYETGRWVGIPLEVEKVTGYESQAFFQFHFYFLATWIEHYTTEFLSKVSEQDKAALAVLYTRVAQGEPAMATCPVCAGKIRISTVPGEREVMCPSGCFRFVGHIVPNHGTTVRAISKLHEDKLNH